MRVDPPGWFDPAFVELVRREVSQADARARQGLAGIDLSDRRGCKDLWYQPAPRKGDKPNGNRCVNCGISTDDVTPGCINCSSRHSMRRSILRRKAGLI